MRKLFIIAFALLLITGSAFADVDTIEGVVTPAKVEGQTQVVAAGGASECDGKLICQNFEGTGYDNGETWSEAGSPNPNYTTSPIRGSQSLYCPSTLAYSEISISPQTNLWIHFAFKSDDITPSSSSSILELYNDTTLLSKIMNHSAGQIWAYHGSSVDTVATGLSDNTVYHIWLNYIASSGSDDGVLNVYYSTNTTRGSVALSISDGTSTGAINKVRLYGRFSNYWFDQVYASTSEITDVDN
jgi:hypothetical protein